MYELARLLYSNVLEGDVHTVSSPGGRDGKILENTFRNINIALANEMATSAKMGIDMQEVIEAGLYTVHGLSRSRPGRALHPHRPFLPDLEGLGIRLPHPAH